MSVDSSGVQASGPSGVPTISADGRFVAFVSTAPDLVANDTNGVSSDVFLRDLQTGQTSLVSVDTSGAQVFGGAGYTGISAQGRYVAFVRVDAFVRDLQTAQTTQVNVDSAGNPGDGYCAVPSISADGRFASFQSNGSSLVVGDTNGHSDIFVHDLQTGETTRVSVSTGGVQANFESHSGQPCISQNGRFVVFWSYASNLIPNDANPGADVFVHDRQVHATSIVSVNSAGIQGDGYSQNCSISGDGRYIAFHSYSTNLVPGDIGGFADIFVRDLQMLTTTRVSIGAGGVQGNGDSWVPFISANGRYVSFQSNASNLVSDDTNGLMDVFVHDRQTGSTTRVSVDTGGAQGNGVSDVSSISGDGRQVVFESDASNLVAGDTNAAGDVLVRDRFVVHGLAFCFGDGTLPTSCPCSPPDIVPVPGSAPGHGCANSFNLAGGLLAATGVLNPDTVTFTAAVGASYAGFGFLVKGNSQHPNGIANGDGLRCVDGALMRFGGHNAGTNGAALGTWTYPNTVQTITVSAATLQSAGQSASYQLFYRNAVAGFCSSGTTNWTNGIRLSWP
ncbi:MAG: TolB family protein [Planctomycetota bacterium]